MCMSQGWGGCVPALSMAMPCEYFPPDTPGNLVAISPWAGSLLGQGLQLLLQTSPFCPLLPFSLSTDHFQLSLGLRHWVVLYYCLCLGYALCIQIKGEVHMSLPNLAVSICCQGPWGWCDQVTQEKGRVQGDWECMYIQIDKILNSLPV